MTLPPPRSTAAISGRIFFSLARELLAQDVRGRPHDADELFRAHGVENEDAVHERYRGHAVGPLFHSVEPGPDRLIQLGRPLDRHDEHVAVLLGELKEPQVARVDDVEMPMAERDALFLLDQRGHVTLQRARVPDDLLGDVHG